MSDECLMNWERRFSFYVVYQAVMRKFTLAGANLFVELSLGEGLEEIASFIFEKAGLYDVNTLNFCIYYVHCDFEGGRLMAFNYSG